MTGHRSGGVSQEWREAGGARRQCPWGSPLPPPPMNRAVLRSRVTARTPGVWAFSEHLLAKQQSASNSLESLKALTTAQLTPCKPFEGLPSNLLCIFWSDLNQTSRNYPSR